MLNKTKTIVVLWIDTDIWWLFHDIPWVIWIKKADFDTRYWKLFDPLHILVNCISEENGRPSDLYDINIKWNDRMQDRARLDDAHYIRISTPRVNNGKWDGTMYWNTMALSEKHITYNKATVIRNPTKCIIEDVIYNWIYWIV